jgi:hypothetical protein
MGTVTSTQENRDVVYRTNLRLIQEILTAGARRPPKRIIPAIREKQEAEYSMRFSELCTQYIDYLPHDQHLEGEHSSNFL